MRVSLRRIGQSETNGSLFCWGSGACLTQQTKKEASSGQVRLRKNFLLEDSSCATLSFLSFASSIPPFNALVTASCSHRSTNFRRVCASPASRTPEHPDSRSDPALSINHSFDLGTSRDVYRVAAPGIWSSAFVRLTIPRGLRPLGRARCC